MVVLSSHFMQAILPLITAATKPLAAPYCGLFTNNVIPTYNTVLAGLTEAVYTGYAEQAVTFETVYGKPDGSIVLQTTLLEFAGPTDTTGQICYGYFILDAITSGNLLMAELFAVPINLSVPPSAAVFSAQLALRPTNNNGQYTQVAP